MDSLNDLNKTIRDFWNDCIALSEEDRQVIRAESSLRHEELAPAEKLYLAAKEFGQCARVLDYGCGSGWASIIAAKEGCPHVDAVDLGENIIDSLSFYVDLFGVQELVQGRVVSPSWLEQAPEATYDGIVCSNVLDVVPMETARSIIAHLAKVAKPGALVVIGLNFYLSPEAAKQRGNELVDGRYFFVNGILRLNCRSDEEWAKEFAPYFDLVRLDHFAWPNEKEETRRLYVLRKK